MPKQLLLDHRLIPQLLVARSLVNLGQQCRTQVFERRRGDLDPRSDNLLNLVVPLLILPVLLPLLMVMVVGVGQRSSATTLQVVPQLLAKVEVFTQHSLKVARFLQHQVDHGHWREAGFSVICEGGGNKLETLLQSWLVQ